MRKRAELLLAVAVAAASIVCLYYPFFRSGGDLLGGDLVDNRLYVTILQHWQSVFLGRAPMASPNFFAPQSNAMALSESMFLFTPFFTLFSIFGADRLLSFQLTLFALRLMGFLSVYLLLRRHLRLSAGASIFSACLFTISNIYFSTGYHAVFAALDYLPLIALLVMEYWTGRSRLFLWAAALLSGFYFLTCYYMAYFSALGAVVFVLCLRPPFSEIRAHIRLGDFAIAILLFGLALIPFLIVYLPVLKDTGGRPYGEAFLYTRGWREFADVGETNWLWGDFLSRGYDSVRQRGLEWGRGWPPITLFTAIAAFCYAISKKRPALIAIGAACVILYLLTVRFGNWSPWWLVFHLIPGGKGTRVPGRMNHIITLGVAILCAVAIQELWKRAGKWRIAAVGLAGILLIEQLNHHIMARVSRATDARTFSKIQPAPAECKTFFAINVRKSNDSSSEDIGHMDAMLLAGATGIPTINGHSGWFAKGWDLHRFDAAYPFQAKTYALEHNLESGFCSVDFSTGEWKLVDPNDSNQYTLGQDITFGIAGNSGRYKGNGWSYAEQTATWTEYREATLWLRLAETPTKDVMLTGDLLGYTPPQHPNLSFKVLANGKETGSFVAPPNIAPMQLNARIPVGILKQGMNVITFQIANPISTAALSISDDDRELGLAVLRLRLE